MIGSHARWTTRGTPPRAPQVLQQPVLLQFDKRCGLETGQLGSQRTSWCLWAPLGITQRAQRGIITWSNWVAAYRAADNSPI